ncbi:MerR family DNA-binding transcriptional regulator [Paenibacillus kobensis]|uniref:MerR family DNA-binding transcriptional regulator n=1 Tax=Paenibacillus kobensis TaxID=59841 RepID=UPI000FD836DA|nr:MerR family DNA-binding transcriptional regulator [Paenibacillus kobensis]
MYGTPSSATPFSCDSNEIQELAVRTGLSIHTIRYYEKEGLLDKAVRSACPRGANNYRNSIHDYESGSGGRP